MLRRVCGREEERQRWTDVGGELCATPRPSPLWEHVWDHGVNCHPEAGGGAPLETPHFTWRAWEGRDLLLPTSHWGGALYTRDAAKDGQNWDSNMYLVMSVTNSCGNVETVREGTPKLGECGIWVWIEILVFWILTSCWVSSSCYFLFCDGEVCKILRWPLDLGEEWEEWAGAPLEERIAILECGVQEHLLRTSLSTLTSF